MTAATTAVEWPTIAELLEGLGGQPQRRPGRRPGIRRSWRIPSSTGGTFLVEVTLRPRWCTITVDRWHTTDRDPTRAEPWLKAHVWPHVQEAASRRRGCGYLPTGRAAWSMASPLDRAGLLDVLADWTRQELTWGLDRQEMGWRER